MVLAAMGVVGWIRLRPLALPGLGWQAEALVRARVAGAGTRDDAAVDAWVAAHPAVFARKVATTRTRLAAQLRYRADDGREHVYLGDLDSYLWLRRARQYLRAGTTCDAIRDGDCRDLHTTTWGTYARIAAATCRTCRRRDPRSRVRRVAWHPSRVRGKLALPRRPLRARGGS